MIRPSLLGITMLAWHVLAACAAEAMRAPGSDYVMPVTFPVLEIRLSEPHHQLCAWAIEGEGGEAPPGVRFGVRTRGPGIGCWRNAIA
jgi:hypothetical protein